MKEKAEITPRFYKVLRSCQNNLEETKLTEEALHQIWVMHRLYTLSMNLY